MAVKSVISTTRGDVGILRALAVGLPVLFVPASILLLCVLRWGVNNTFTGIILLLAGGVLLLLILAAAAHVGAYVIGKRRG